MLKVDILTVLQMEGALWSDTRERLRGELIRLSQIEAAALNIIDAYTEHTWPTMTPESDLTQRLAMACGRTLPDKPHQGLEYLPRGGWAEK